MKLFADGVGAGGPTPPTPKIDATLLESVESEIPRSKFRDLKYCIFPPFVHMIKVGRQWENIGQANMNIFIHFIY